MQVHLWSMSPFHFASTPSYKHTESCKKGIAWYSYLSSSPIYFTFLLQPATYSNWFHGVSVMPTELERGNLLFTPFCIHTWRGVMVHSDFHHFALSKASLLHGYPHCTHKYSQRAKLLWKTSIGRLQPMHSNEVWMHHYSLFILTLWCQYINSYKSLQCSDIAISVQDCAVLQRNCGMN